MWRSLIAAIVIALIVLLLTACTLVDEFVDEAQELGNKYCAQYTASERQALRERINQGWQHRLTLQCNP